MTIGDLFQPKPPRWGLRGDPMLWQDMHAVLGERPLPASLDSFRDLLHRSFDALTGHPIDTMDSVLKVEAYRRPNGGMSNSLVSVEFWRETAIPLIEARFLRETNCNDDN